MVSDMIALTMSPECICSASSACRPGTPACDGNQFMGVIKVVDPSGAIVSNGVGD